MPKVLSASHMPRTFMGGSQMGGAGALPVLFIQTRPVLRQALNLNFPKGSYFPST